MSADGAPPQAYRITNGTLSAWALPYGASLADLRLAGWRQPLVLGFGKLSDYIGAPHYSGAIVGRHCNRLGAGRALIGDEVVQLDRNAAGVYHLHGGERGFARQNWHVVDHQSDQLRLHLDSPDGYEGYPGNLSVTICYMVREPATLVIEATATTDQRTIVNLCHHPYFNLSGAGDIDDHLLTVNADHFLAADGDLVPTGVVASVAGTNLDFRIPRQPLAEAGKWPEVINHTLCLAAGRRQELTFAARLEASDSPVLDLWTDQCALHVYNGYKMAKGLVGQAGRLYGPRAGLCLEAQNWTDAPNHPHFPTSELAPGEVYRYCVEYRFS